jgi:hypothetical protein
LQHRLGLLNASELARALAVSTQTVTRYIDLLVDLLLVRRLRPYHANVGKRLVKSPKVYVRDSGVVHALLDIAPPALRGTAFGLFNLTAGLMLLPASLLFGALYQGAGALAAFGFSAACALTAALLLTTWALGDFCQIMHHLTRLFARLPRRADSHIVRLCSYRHSLKAHENPSRSGT